jgi:hypothetical protein
MALPMVDKTVLPRDMNSVGLTAHMTATPSDHWWEK